MARPSYFSQLVPRTGSRDAVPLLQPRPLLFRPGGSGADLLPHIWPAAQGRAWENARSPGSPTGRGATPMATPPAQMATRPAPMATPPAPMATLPLASLAPVAAAAQIPPPPRPERAAGPAVMGRDAPSSNRIPDPSEIQRSAEPTGTAASSAPPQPFTGPTPSLPRPHRIAPAVDAPAAGLRIGTLEVRVAAPRTAPQPQARPVQPRQSAPASAPARIARPFATFGFNQS